MRMLLIALSPCTARMAIEDCDWAATWRTIKKIQGIQHPQDRPIRPLYTAPTIRKAVRDETKVESLATCSHTARIFGGKRTFGGARHVTMRSMRLSRCAGLILLLAGGPAAFSQTPKLQALIITGQNNHDWRG